jgi:hypothetical protein
MIATALGRPAPESGSPESAQWDMWTMDALLLIQNRVDATSPAPTVDQAKLDYVVREAVVAQVRRPDSATQVTTAVDDGSVSKTYRTGSGRVAILDEWWSLLGLTDGGGNAYAIDTVGTSTTHQDWCSLAFGALYCSCGADIAGSPIYEGGGWF